MHPSLSLALRVSRPRFWFYTGGTYVVGFALGMASPRQFFDPAYSLYLLYFFLPANLFIYGVNDWWDREADAANPKKDHMEYRMQQSDASALFGIVAFAAAISLALMLLQSWQERLVFAAFLALAYFYSAGPLRFKEVPVLDFSSNVLYIMPGVFGYLLASGTFPPPIYLLGGALHTSAMHLFSAVPDIGPDRRAHITTTATAIGERPSLLLCTIFWSLFAGIVIVCSGLHPLSLPVLLYPAVTLSLLLLPSPDIKRVYWWFPLINTSLGGLLFAAVTISKTIA